MKNKYQLLTALFLLALVSLGCSFLPGGGSSSGGPQSGNTAGNTAVVTNSNAAPMAKTGIPECDEVVDLITRDMQSQEDGYIAGKIKEMAVDYVKQSIKDSIEQNQGDKTKVANDCRLIKQEYERQRSQSNSNQ